MKDSQIKEKSNPADNPPSAPEEELVETEELDNQEDKQSFGSQLSDDPLVNKKVFETRRKMAWISLYLMVAMVIIGYLYVLFSLFLFMNSPELMISLTDTYKIHLEWAVEIIGWGFLSFSSVVLGYMGTTIISHTSFLRKKK